MRGNSRASKWTELIYTGMTENYWPMGVDYTEKMRQEGKKELAGVLIFVVVIFCLLVLVWFVFCVFFGGMRNEFR